MEKITLVMRWYIFIPHATLLKFRILKPHLHWTWCSLLPGLLRYEVPRSGTEQLWLRLGQSARSALGEVGSWTYGEVTGAEEPPQVWAGSLQLPPSRAQASLPAQVTAYPTTSLHLWRPLPWLIKFSGIFVEWMNEWTNLKNEKTNN